MSDRERLANLLAKWESLAQEHRALGDRLEDNGHIGYSNALTDCATQLREIVGLRAPEPENLADRLLREATQMDADAQRVLYRNLWHLCGDASRSEGTVRAPEGPKT